MVEPLPRSRFALPLQLVIVATLLLPAGCASIICGRCADVEIKSVPENAQVTIHNKKGEVIAQTTTPVVVTLKRGEGFWKPANYTATFEKPGYQTVQAPIHADVNPWVFGNVLFGVFGGVGGLVVDPSTGAMWRPTPAEIEQQLCPQDSLQIVPAQYESAEVSENDGAQLGYEGG